MQAAQGQPALNAAVDDDRADATLADDKPFVREPLDGLAHGGTAHAEPLAQLDLVVETVAWLESARINRSLEILGYLEIERHRACLVHRPADSDPARQPGFRRHRRLDGFVQGVEHAGYWSGHAFSLQLCQLVAQSKMSRHSTYGTFLSRVGAGQSVAGDAFAWPCNQLVNSDVNSLS